MKCNYEKNLLFLLHNCTTSNNPNSHPHLSLLFIKGRDLRNLDILHDGAHDLSSDKVRVGI